ncbi:MAG: D-ribose-binding periplasmic protein precursor [Lentisphaerae bacterium ADurb.Bin242]|nr:MAG: D-ribose-binding periplasmic protein precursor [Lentisphaerae bacterium ADurb.Bin242]
MKKFLTVLFFALCAAALLFGAGCGKTSEKIRIGVSIPSADHGWTGGVVWWAEQAKKDLESKDPKLEIILSTARDSAEQVNKIENLLVQGVKAVVVLPQEPAPLTGVCEQLKKKGIYLVVVDRGLQKDVQDLLVVGDNREFGRRCAEEMAKRLNGKGEILIMEGIPCEVNTLRVEAFREVMKNHPQITILESQSASWSTEKGLKLMENFLQKYKKIDAVWAGDDDVLIGALKAYEESKRKDIKFFIGGGGSKTIVKKVLNNDPLVPVNVTYPPRMIAYGIEYAAAAAKGTPKTREKRVTISADVITPKNAKFFYYPNSIY